MSPDKTRRAPDKGVLLGMLSRPWIDRGIAVVAIVPFLYVLWFDIQLGHLTLPRVAVLLQIALLVGTMLLRTPPVRVTANPLIWGLAFVASYYGFLTAGWMEAGHRLVPALVSDTISVVSVILDGYARVSLGRNIGFVPAQRQLVMTGPYRLVRHPIYGALFVAEVSVVLEAYSRRNLLTSAVFIGLFVIKTLIEERFLAHDPTYARYLKQVRYRWIPGLI